MRKRDNQRAAPSIKQQLNIQESTNDFVKKILFPYCAVLKSIILRGINATIFPINI